MKAGLEIMQLEVFGPLICYCDETIICLKCAAEYKSHDCHKLPDGLLYSTAVRDFDFMFCLNLKVLRLMSTILMGKLKELLALENVW